MPCQKLISPLDLLDQSFLDGDRSPSLRQLEGGEATEVCPGDIHLRLPHEDGHHVLEAPVHGQVEGGLTRHLVLSIHIHPGLEKDANNLGKVALDSEVEGELAKIIRKVGIGLKINIEFLNVTFLAAVKLTLLPKSEVRVLTLPFLTAMWTGVSPSLSGILTEALMPRSMVITSVISSSTAR